MKTVPDANDMVVVEMAEWETLGPSQDPRLRGRSFANEPELRAAVLLRDKIDIRELREGIEISTSSFVGHIDFGGLRIAVRPKLPSMPLARLLRYAYGLRDLDVVSATQAPTTSHGLLDIIIDLLRSEVDELLHSGLARRYVPVTSSLVSPRGQILVTQLIRNGGVLEAELPCRHFERRADWHLNQVLRAGLIIAAELAQDRDLRRRVHRIAESFLGVEAHSNLSIADVDRAILELTRLTDTCRPALTIIRLLLENRGVEFKSGEKTTQIPGFFFDMNMFFQRLLSRFLREHLGGSRIMDERAITNLFLYTPSGNPRSRRLPMPRPDYALYKEKALSSFLDAKYRDVWLKGYPVEWLYQLSMYALSSPCGSSVMLYASTSEEARQEHIEIHQPIKSIKGSVAAVVFRPVPMLYLASILGPNKTESVVSERKTFAERLVSMSVD